MSSTSVFLVTGMTCGHCEMSVREEVSEIDGVEGVEVSAQDGRLIVTASAPVSDEAGIAAGDEAGYTAARI